MIKLAKKFVTHVLLISTLPLIFTTLVWCVSLGAFSYFDAVHSSTFVTLSAFFTFLGLCLGANLVIENQ